MNPRLRTEDVNDQTFTFATRGREKMLIRVKDSSGAAHMIARSAQMRQAASRTSDDDTHLSTLTSR